VRAWSICVNELYLILSTKNFFTIYRNLFSRLGHDESLISNTSYPSFGNSTWPWTAATNTNGDESAKVFYSSWMNFATAKDFTWMDKYNLSDAPDRRNRRLALFRCDLFICAQIMSGYWRKRTRNPGTTHGKTTMTPSECVSSFLNSFPLELNTSQ